MFAKPLTAALALTMLTTLAVPMAEARSDGKAARLPAFETLDTNNDGKIDRTEASAALTGRMDGADADGDGIITAAELKAHMVAAAIQRAETNAARMLERLDANKDGQISTEELAKVTDRQQERFTRMFNRLDRDEDGAISKAEYDRMADRMDRRGDKRGEQRRQGPAKN